MSAYSEHWKGTHDTKWNTHKSLLAMLHQRFDFDFDPAPADWDMTWDGLTVGWGSRNYVNPPYNNAAAWIEKALAERAKGKLSVFLLMANTTTEWFSKLWNEANEIWFVYPRVNYGDRKSSAPWGSIIAVIRPEWAPLVCHRYKWKSCRMDSKPLGLQ